MAPAIGDLEFELTRLLRRSRSNQARIAAEVHPDLDVAAYAVLVTIRDHAPEHGGQSRASDVAEVLGLHKSTMSRNIGTLEALGLIERIPDPDDARARGIRMTAAGTEALDRTFSGRRTKLREHLDGWDEDDVRSLAGLLRRYNDSF